MSAFTFLVLTNAVLTRLREANVAGVFDTEYSGLVAQLVNEAKREVEDAWKWSALRTTKTVTTAAGTSQYAITGAGERFKLQSTTNSVYDATNLARLRRQPAVWMKEALLNDTNQGFPGHYYFEGLDSNGDPYVNLYSIPDGVYTINFDLVVPDASLSSNSDSLTLVQGVWPIVLGAWAKAVAERGEDDGRTHGELLMRYNQALSDAIAIDESLTTDETMWYYA